VLAVSYNSLMAVRFVRMIPPLVLIFVIACSRPPNQPDSSTTLQGLPFDHSTPPSGSSNPYIIPSPMGLPEGTFLTVRLSNALSSVSAHAGDGFRGAIDEPVVVDQQTFLPRGAQVSGRVLDAKPSDGPHNPGYLRITLLSVDVGGKTIPIDTSSIFTKATQRNDRPSSGATSPAVSDVLLTPDRRLTFRLAQAVDLQ